MAEFDVVVEVLSAIHLGSGSADVNIDSEIVHDSFGLPYFPAKRFKGLLYESALEVKEMFTLAEMDFDASIIENIFHHRSDKGGNISKIQLIVPNLYIKPYEEYQKLCTEWNYLQNEYPETFRPSDLLNVYTSIRYQTQLEDGVAVDGSLHNMRVLNSDIKFYGKLILKNSDNKHLQIIAFALKNLS